MSQFGVEGGLDGVGGVAHAGVHPQALSVLYSGEILESSTSAGGLPLVFTHKLCRFYCKSVSLQNEKKTQAPNHVVIRLHDGAIEAELRDLNTQ